MISKLKTSNKLKMSSQRSARKQTAPLPPIAPMSPPSSTSSAPPPPPDDSPQSSAGGQSLASLMQKRSALSAEADVCDLFVVLFVLISQFKNTIGNRRDVDRSTERSSDSRSSDGNHRESLFVNICLRIRLLFF